MFWRWKSVSFVNLVFAGDNVPFASFPCGEQLGHLIHCPQGVVKFQLLAGSSETWFYTLADGIIWCNILLPGSSMFHSFGDKHLGSNTTWCIVTSTGFFSVRAPLAIFLLWHASWPKTQSVAIVPSTGFFNVPPPSCNIPHLRCFWADNFSISALCKQKCHILQIPRTVFESFEHLNPYKVFSQQALGQIVGDLKDVGRMFIF